jgi:hypothetical protein
MSNGISCDFVVGGHIVQESIHVDASYTGPRYESKHISREFIVAMMEEFKQQRKVHRRYVLECVCCMYQCPQQSGGGGGGTCLWLPCAVCEWSVHDACSDSTVMCA